MTTLAEFKMLLRRSREEGRAYAPVIETIKMSADPVALYQIMTGKRSPHKNKPACILQSGSHGAHGRYSIVCVNGKDPAVVQSRSDLALLKGRLLAESPVRHETLPFIGGAVGYIGHEAVTLIEKTVERHPVDPFEIPKACLYFFRDIMVIDHELEEMHVIANVNVEGAADGVYDSGCRRIEELKALLSAEAESVPPDFVDPRNIRSNMTAGEYYEMVRTAKTFIEKGDVFQTVLSQRFSVPYQGSGLALYETLRKLNPSPYMFYMNFTGDSCRNMTLLGASPEVMVGIDGTDMRIKPIAGTRRRGKTPAEDIEIARELLSDPKERAEHMMLVDLARNDIGRFCKAASVKLETLMSVEQYSHVMHIVSEVHGKLRDGVHSFDACLGSLPAGTLSGAPKIRALQIISALEKSQRGTYGGAFGWFTDASLDTCILIRSAMLLDGTLHWQTGGGVVADSLPESEYQETLIKAKAISAAIEKIGGSYEK